MPPCLRGALGKVENFRSSKEGQPCSLSGAQQVEISTVEDGKVGMEIRIEANQNGGIT